MASTLAGREPAPCLEPRKLARLNFMVVGDCRAGTEIVRSALDRLPEVVCHGNLIDLGTPESQRRRAHEAYFGESPENPPEWFTDDGNAYCYLTDRVFDRARLGESHVGVRLPYDTLVRFDLFDLIEERWREGDFCLIHVRRNPVACLVSRRQAEESGVWSRPAECRVGPYPLPVSLTPQEVTAVVNRHQAVVGKLRAACPDSLEVQFRDLVFDYAATMRDLLEFLELPRSRVPRPECGRLANKDMCRRLRDAGALAGALSGEARRAVTEGLF